MREGEPGRLVRVLPLLMFLIFAVFWGAYDVVQGLYVALIPSAVVGALLLLAVIVPRKEGRS